MNQEHFFTFSDLIFKAVPFQNKNKLFKLREVRWLRFDKTTEIKYKMSLDPEEDFHRISFFKKGQKINQFAKF